MKIVIYGGKNQVAKLKFLDNFDEIIIATPYVINILSFLIPDILTIIGNIYIYIYIYMYYIYTYMLY